MRLISTFFELGARGTTPARETRGALATDFAVVRQDALVRQDSFVRQDPLVPQRLRCRATGSLVRQNVLGRHVASHGTPGAGLAAFSIVGARHHSELVAWQLASELRDQMLAVVARPGVARHFKYCEQVADSASSVPRNIAEGFARFSHGDFRRFLGFALASRAELRTLLDEALVRGFVDEPTFAALKHLAWRVDRTTTRLKQSL